ncbi:GAF domain-containing protein [Arthrobacter sp. H5]|uniref:GAF domain-containing protein n=1 Tax=Arthrobacter sp. H5 TaxID=1267973 RepID=UPI0004B2E3EF|nr:GAF domain-containing protein [Arthrobacter sp. H5]
MINPFLQQWFTAQAVAEAALAPDRIWANYRTLGGRCDCVEVGAYLHGLLLIDNLQRDMLSHAINELLDDAASPARRAAYTTDDVSLKSGSITASSFESCTDAALKKFVTASSALFAHDDQELRRLDSLRRTGLMGTPAEERFDRITREAQQMFGVNSSSLALIGEHQQFIKSLAGPIGQNVPRSISFCNETIRHDDVTVVHDALKHEQFVSNPLVQRKPHIRFYAGYPLTGPGGWRIGSLCIVDDRPRGFTSDDETRLLALAARAQDELESTDGRK